MLSIFLKVSSNSRSFIRFHDPFVFPSRNQFQVLLNGTKLVCVLLFLHRELTKVPHMATSAGDEKTVQFMLKRWQDSETGLDQAWREEYMVYLSFPDPKKPNKVTVGERTGHSLLIQQILWSLKSPKLRLRS